MPILYPIACVNFFVIFWVYKTLIIKHYQKTTSFNEEMPVFTIWFYRIGVIFHVLVGCFMYTNSNILSNRNIEAIHALEDLLQDFIPQNHFFTRFGNSIGLLYFLFTLFVLLMLSLKKIGPILFNIFYCIFCCNMQKSRK